MADLVLDTDALADFLTQFYGPANRGQGRFTASEWLSEPGAREINRTQDQRLCRIEQLAGRIV